MLVEPLVFQDVRSLFASFGIRFFALVSWFLLELNWALHFSQREHDFESAILDMIFLKFHHAFGARRLILRRTSAFTLAKSCIGPT